MIFKNNTSNDLVSQIQNHPVLKRVQIILRFNTTSLTDIIHTLVIRASAMQMKIFVSIYADRIVMVAHEKMAVRPFNIKSPYRELETVVIPRNKDDDCVRAAAVFIADFMTRKSEFVFDLENGHSGFLTAVHSFKLINETNVFTSKIIAIGFGDGVTLTTEDAIIKLTNSDVEKLPNTENIVGRYLIMNSRKEFIIVPWPVYCNMVKDYHGNQTKTEGSKKAGK